MLRALVALALATTVAACGSSQASPAAATETARLTAAPTASPSLAVSPAASPTQRATATPSSPQPPPASPQPTAVTEPSAACASSATGSIIGEQALIVDVRVGSHDGYDRIVFEFASRESPARDQSTYEINRATPPYHQDPSDLPLAIAGDPVLKITLRGATTARLDGSSSYAGSRDFVPGFPVLRELKERGDFEAISSWLAGLNGTACVQAQMLTNPARLVIDLRRP